MTVGVSPTRIGISSGVDASSIVLALPDEITVIPPAVIRTVATARPSQLTKGARHSPRQLSTEEHDCNHCPPGADMVATLDDCHQSKHTTFQETSMPDTEVLPS
jgi:hypothetical protein